MAKLRAHIFARATVSRRGVTVSHRGVTSLTVMKKTTIARAKGWACQPAKRTPKEEGTLKSPKATSRGHTGMSPFCFQETTQVMANSLLLAAHLVTGIALPMTRLLTEGLLPQASN